MITFLVVLNAILVAVLIGFVACLYSEQANHLAELLKFMDEPRKKYTLRQSSCYCDVLAKSHSSFVDEYFVIKRFYFNPDSEEDEAFALLEAQELWEKLNEK